LQQDVVGAASEENVGRALGLPMGIHQHTFIVPFAPLTPPEVLDRTFLAVSSPPVQLPPGSLVQVSCLLNVPEAIKGSPDGALFYDEAGAPLTPARYRAWLSEQAVAYVALPDAPLDYSASAEARLLRGGARSGAPPPYLREVWRSPHWRLFAVLDPRPLARAPAQLSAVASDSFTLAAPAAGAYEVRVHFTPYWALASGRGCVAEAAGGWTRVSARAPGSYPVVIRFSLGRVFGHGPRCR